MVRILGSRIITQQQMGDNNIAITLINLNLFSCELIFGFFSLQQRAELPQISKVLTQYESTAKRTVLNGPIPHYIWPFEITIWYQVIYMYN